MPIVKKPANFYTGKVRYLHDFTEETKSISVIVKVLTENGRPIKPKAVRFSLSEDHPLAQGLYDRTISEIGYEANGFSPEPIEGTEDLYAINGLRARTLDVVLGGTYTTGEVLTDAQELKRSEGMATRAREWMNNVRSAMAAAVKG